MMTALETLDHEEFIPTLIKVPSVAGDSLKTLPARRTGGARVLPRGLLVSGLAIVLIAGSVGSSLLLIRQTHSHISTQTTQNGPASAARTQTSVAALAACPAAGQVRSLVNSPLPAEHGKSLVYLSDANGVQKLERYDSSLQTPSCCSW